MFTDERQIAVPLAKTLATPASSAFVGFAAPTSNTTYIPNQFFDVVLPHCSRGAVRLIGYMLRKTLGWCDSRGNAQDDHVIVAYQELIDKAGISRDMVRRVLDEAVAGRFVRCVREGQPSRAGHPAVSALYELRWDKSGQYVKDPAAFQGFFEGEGNRTDIPNQFFDYVIPTETLTVIKVVGAVIRLSIGWADGRGRRRKDAQLSYTHIQNYTRIGDRKTLAASLSDAVKKNYIVRTAEGHFDPNAGRLSVAASYSLRWMDRPVFQTSQKTPPGDQSENPTGKPVRNSHRHQSENPTGDRSENPTGIETKLLNETSKQQQPDVAAEISDRLEAEGFNHQVARQLAASYTAERILRQIQFASQRVASRNRVGMLRRAIEQDWPAPDQLETSQVSANTPATRLAQNFYAGYHDNPGEPISTPSVNDLRAAERLSAQLVRECPDVNRMEQWGRMLGGLYRERCTSDGRKVVSFVQAVRVCGDGFIVRVRAARDAEARKVAEAKRVDRSARFRADWIAYILGQATWLSQQRPADYQRFEKVREKRRQELMTGRFVRNVDEAIIHFDSDTQRAKALREFFSDSVLDFDAWDKKFNQHNT